MIRGDSPPLQQSHAFGVGALPQPATPALGFGVAATKEKPIETVIQTAIIVEMASGPI
jgi:hypothetical protein